MNTRELLATINADPAIVYTGLGNVALKIEEAITQGDLFDQDVIQSFKDSKKDGRYIIHAADPDLIKNAKALLNLLRSLEALMPVINPVVDAARSTGWFSTAFYGGKALLGIGRAAWQGDISHAKTDIQHFSFYISQLKKLIPDVTGLNVEARAILEQLQTSGSAQIVSDMVTTRKLRRKCLATAAVMPIENLEQIRSKLLVVRDAISDDEYTALLARIGRIEKFQRSMGDEVITWDKLAETQRNDYFQVIGGLRLICDARNDIPDKQLNNKKAKAFKFLSDWLAKDRAALNIKGASGKLGVMGTLEIVHAAALGRVSENIKRDCLDKASSRFIFSPDAADISAADKNAMLVANLTLSAQSVLARLSRSQEVLSEGKLTNLMGVLATIGEMVKQFDHLQVENDTKETLERALREIFRMVGPLYQQMVMLALETELRMDLREGVLIGKFDTFAKQYESFSTRMKIPPQPVKPYENEKILVAARYKTEVEANRDLLMRVQTQLNEVNPENFLDLPAAIKIRDVVSEVKTPAGYDLQRTLDETIKHLCGLDELEKKVTTLESKILIAANNQLGTDDDFITVDIDEDMEEQIEELRMLYQSRTMLNNMIAAIRRGDFTSTAGLMYYEDGDIQTGLRDVSGADMDLLCDQVAAVQADALGLIKRDEATIHKMEKIIADRAQANSPNSAATIPELPQQALEESAVESEADFTLRIEDDNAIVQDIINRNKGKLVLSLGVIRNKILDKAGDYLNASHAPLLSRDKRTNGLFQPESNDSLITANVKAVHNVLIMAEKLAIDVKILKAKLAAGEYTGIPVQAYKIIDDLSTFNQQAKAANTAMQTLIATMNTTAVGSAREEVVRLFALAGDIPARLAQVRSDLQTEFLAAIAPQGVGALQDMTKESGQLLEHVAALETGQEVTEAVEARELGLADEIYAQFTDGINAYIQPLKKLIPDDAIINKRGIYETESMDSGKNIAMLMNAATYLGKTLQATTIISEGNKVAGLSKIIKNVVLLKAELNKLKESPEFQENKEEVVALFNYLSRQLELMLQTLKPIYRDIYAYTALSEQVLGFKSGMLTSQLENMRIPEMIAEFGNGFQNTKLGEVRPYLAFGKAVRDANFGELVTNRPYYAAQYAMAKNELLKFQKLLDESIDKPQVLKNQVARLQVLIVELEQKCIEHKEKWDVVDWDKLMSQQLTSPPLAEAAPIDEVVGEMNAVEMSEPEGTAEEQSALDDKKVEELQRVCLDYMKDQACIYLACLKNADPDLYRFYMNKEEYAEMRSHPVSFVRQLVNQKNNIIQNIEANNAGINLDAMKKAESQFIAVAALAHPLYVDESSSREKVNIFKQGFKFVGGYLDADTGGKKFVNAVKAILKYGIGATFRMWRSERTEKKIALNIGDEDPAAKNSRGQQKKS